MRALYSSVPTCAPSRGEIQAFSGTRYSAVLTRPRHVVAILGPGGMREASENRAPIRIACCVCAVCGMSYLCVARRMHYMRDARRARCIYAVCWVGCQCGACQMHSVRDARRARCLCIVCGVSCRSAARAGCTPCATRVEHCLCTLLRDELPMGRACAEYTPCAMRVKHAAYALFAG